MKKVVDIKEKYNKILQKQVDKTNFKIINCKPIDAIYQTTLLDTLALAEFYEKHCDKKIINEANRIVSKFYMRKFFSEDVDEWFNKKYTQIREIADKYPQ